MNATAHNDSEASSFPDSLTPIKEDFNFDWDHLVSSRNVVTQIVGDLRKDYPSLKPYLVLTIMGEFVDADSSILSMLKKAPGIFLENECKAICKQHLKKNPPAHLLLAKMKPKLDLWMKKWNEEFNSLSVGLCFRPDALFEVRLGHLDYEEIWRMQKDRRVDAARTPRTRASIRIVLGSLREFVECDQD